jgi:hypothetical protein
MSRVVMIKQIEMSGLEGTPIVQTQWDIRDTIVLFL